MWSYSQTEQPPAPFLVLSVVHPGDDTKTFQIDAKIDTGADISALPASILGELGLPMVSKLMIEGYDGALATVSTYAALLEVGTVRFRVQEIIAIPESYALLGRDVLNHFYLYLRGPDLTLEVSVHPLVTSD